MSPVEVTRGRSPVILGFPHTGTHLPRAVGDRLNANGRLLANTDWHVETLYRDLLPGATTVRATFHRYVIDANRDPAGESLYPGQNTTALVPTTDFDGLPIWQEGQEPTDGEVDARAVEFHAPYHAALAAEIARIKAIHGVAVLYDCHSIRSRVPFLFEGVLPDFNVGTYDARSCSPEFESAVAAAIRFAGGYTHVVNGRFKGGWTTRHYGRPVFGVHAVQMELAQSSYLRTEAPPFELDPGRAEKLRVPLQTILQRIEQTALGLSQTENVP